MTEQIFIPVQQYLESLWPSSLVELPEIEAFQHIWMEPLNVQANPEMTVSTALLFETSLELGIPGLDSLKLVIAPMGTATSFMLRFEAAPAPSISLVSVPIALRLRGDMLRPARLGGVDAKGVRAWEVDPTREFVDIELASVTVKLDFDGNITVQAGVSIDLPPVMIGDSGIVIEAQDIQLFLDTTASPPGKPAGWKGVYIAHCAVHLPAGLSDSVGTLSMENAFIGNGGFSGSVTLDFAPALAAPLFGMNVTLEHVELSFTQNALTGSDIRGTLQVPFFDEPVGIAIALGLDGSFLAALDGGANGLLKLTKPDVLELTVDSLGFAVHGGRFVACLSGSVRPLVGGLDWPEMDVRELSIDSDGNVHVDGGWLDLREGYRLDLAGFGFEITRLGLGTSDDGGRWVGFSGALKLVDGMSAGASVEGLRVTWYDDSRRPALTLNGVGVEFEVPDVLRFQGEVALRELPGGVRRFDGAIKLDLTTLKLEIDGQLVIGTANGHSFLAIYLGTELPAGIPLWTTGLGLYGIAGLFALNMEPDKSPQEPWYGVGPNEGWYKKPQIGVSDLAKWRNEEGSLALGAGITIGTVADNGFTFGGRMLLAIVFPGPIILIEGKANLLKERSALSEDPLFRALAVIDGREGTFLVGLDVAYKFANGGELIAIGGGAEALFDFDDPTAWHLYLGQRNPRERLIRAEIFKLFEANAYLMLDPHQLATGAFIGYDGHWRFGPVRASLEAWIEGNAVLSFKPQQFYGDLWLHGRMELRVFDFGFDIGADARTAAEVFDPFLIKMELSVHLDLPWPLPDFDVGITLQWGPEPNAPALPMPLKEVAVGHLKVTTFWPLPRSVAPALLAPNYDGDNDGYLGAPDQAPAVIAAAPPPANAPVIPLDARPQITFGRNVHDDALVGINPQPIFPDAQPDPGWEWIGDPSRNQGPVRIRTALKEVALDRWQESSGSWTTVARKGPGANASGMARLYGAWAPVPKLPGGAPGSKVPPGQTKLLLWSRSAFDYVRHTTGQWSDWWASTADNYPCVPIPSDEEICCSIKDLVPGSQPISPWRCPDHSEFALGWPFPVRPEVIAGRDGLMLCFGRGGQVEMRLGMTVKRLRLFIRASERGEKARQCLDFKSRQQRTVANPYVEDGFSITVRSHDGSVPPTTRLIRTGAAQVGLDIGFACEIVLPGPVDGVRLLVRVGGNVSIAAFSADGQVVDEIAQVPSGEQTVVLNGAWISRIRVKAPSDETLIYDICTELGRSDLEVVGVDHAGNERDPVPVQGGVAELDGRDLTAVRIRDGGRAFCISGFCAIVGLSRDERMRREAMNQHLLEETAHWHGAGDVLQPYAQYRLRIVTTLETRGFAYDAGFNKVREHTEFAYFRTSGPPGLAALSAPITAQAPAEASTGLSDLVLYVSQTMPPTVQGRGEKPPLPRPVYRAYDVGVNFNEDYVDLLYRSSGRDLNVYLFDSNNQPARDIFGKLLVAPTSWGRAERIQLSQTDRAWIDVVNASSCAAIDENLIVKTRTLRVEGQVLRPDTCYEARLIPLLLHETFANMAIGQSAIGDGATLTGPAGGWIVADAGTNEGPSRWVVGEGGTPPTRHVEQQSNVWGGSDVASNPNNPGTILLRASDPMLAANHPDQPNNWTDYRFTAVLRAIDNDSLGVVFRYSGASDHYLFAMDRERSYRRLVRVAGGIYTVLAMDSTPYLPDSDMTISVEAIGDRIRIYQDGALLFDVADTTHATGGIGLYCWAMQGARFSDIRVDDLRAAAPVVYRFAFTTSRFANFHHHLQSGTGQIWRASLPDVTGLADGAAAALPCAGLPAIAADSEWRAYAALSEKIAGTAARKDTERVEATAGMLSDEVSALLLRTAEPIDWARTTLGITHAGGTGPAFVQPSDAVPAKGPIHITNWTSAPAEPATPKAESVTLLLDDDINPDGWQIDYRTLASPDAPDLPDGQNLFSDAFLGIAESAEKVGAVLFRPLLRDLSGFSVKDPPPVRIAVPSEWTAAGGVAKQTRLSGSPASAGGLPFAMIGTHLVSDVAFRDARIGAILRTDLAGGAFGMVFRYLDERNYYRFSLSPKTGRRLVKCKGGVFTLLWHDKGAVAVGAEHKLVIETVGGAIRIMLNRTRLCEVRDIDIASGRAGFYAWRCRSAFFRKLEVRRFSQVLEEWSVVEFGALATASRWQRGGAAMKQVAAIAGAAVGSVDPTAMGAYVVAGDLAWNDVRAKVRISADPVDAAGIAVRWRGLADHLLLLLDSRTGHVKLIRRTDGIATTLFDKAVPMPAASWHEAVLETIGTRLRGWLNGVLLFDFHETSQPRGAIALFAAASGGARFAGLRVESARPQWMSYATLGGIGLRAGGRRVRLFAGRAADVALPPATGEVCAYQDFLTGDAAGVRLPAEGVDLRLLDPTGQVVHARRFAPDPAFVPSPVTILRAPDGAGLILLKSDAAAPGGTKLEPGIYRLNWHYRRDNSATVPGTLALSERGDTMPESAQIDIYV